jgi:hypothetical protein
MSKEVANAWSWSYCVPLRPIKAVFKPYSRFKRLLQHLANSNDSAFPNEVFLCNNQTLAKVHYLLFCKNNLDCSHQEVVWVILVERFMQAIMPLCPKILIGFSLVFGTGFIIQFTES